MTTEENKQIVQRYLQEVWGKGNLAAVDELLSTNYSLEVLYRNPGRPQQLVNNPQALKQAIPMYRQAFPDLTLTAQRMIAEGDTVVVQWTAHATHQGAFRGIEPTGKAVNYSGINIYQLKDGKIVQELYSGDRLGLWQQLGLVPESPRLVQDAREETAS